MSFLIDDDLIEKVARAMVIARGEDPDLMVLPYVMPQLTKQGFVFFPRQQPELLWRTNYAEARQSLLLLQTELPVRGYVITKAEG